MYLKFFIVDQCARTKLIKYDYYDYQIVENGFFF